MPIKNISITPIGYKDLKEEETFVPYHLELWNGKLTDAGNWYKRPGFNSGSWDLSAVYPVNLLIPHSIGYAINSNKSIYKLSSTDTTATELTGQKLTGTYRPKYALHNDIVIICDGGQPVKIESGDTALLGGSPPKARFASRISSYLLLTGYNDTEISYSAPGNPENFTDGGSGTFNIQKIGGSIKNALVLRDKYYVFTDKHIEVWSPFGVTSVSFQQITGLKIDKGCGADYSVVQANDTFYWFGNDGDFYVLNNGIPQVISKSYRKELDKLVGSAEIYGFDFRKEGVIRWFAPVDGKTFVYDYVKGNFSEDNYWGDNQAGRMPVNAYMELGNKQYIGDYEPTGKIYDWSHDHKDDNGIPINVYRKFAVKLSERGNQCVVKKARFRFKRGVETSGEGSPELMVKFRFDQGDFSPEVKLSMGQYGDRNPWLDYINPWDGGYIMGVGREMEFVVNETDAVDFLLTDILIDYDEMGR